MSVSSRGRPASTVPLGLLGMLALVAAVEAFVWRHHDLDFATIGSSSWTQSGRAARSKAAKCEVLCFGDSLVKLGILPQVIEERLGRRAYNLAVHGGGPQASYLLLRRSLESGARPRALVVDFPLESLMADHLTIHMGDWPELASIRDCVELAWAARDADLFTTTTLARVLPSFHDRLDIRANVLTALRGEDIFARRALPVLWRNWNRNAGAQAMPRNPAFLGNLDEPTFWPLFHDSWHCSPINAIYVKKFLKLAQSRGIPVFWLIQPICPQAQALREKRGVDGHYLAFVRRVHEKSPNLVVVDGRHSGYDHRVFIDPIHLDRQGESTLSTEVAGVLGRYLGMGEPGSRWVDLPPYRDQSAGRGFEDIMDSGIALRSGEGRVRR